MVMAKKETSHNIVIKNRKAEFEYFLLTVYTAVLSFPEPNKIYPRRESQPHRFFCSFINNELWVHDLHISEYIHGSYNNHEPKRDRKLLLNKKELKKIMSKLNERGMTIIPTKLWINENGYAKLDIALAKGKKMYDKRESIKEKDNRREEARGEES
jgi:SsrA-binding protein